MKRKTIAALLLAAVFVLPHAGPARADSFRDALRALEAGETETARTVFRDLAERGNRNAQFMMGVLYEDGLGVGQDFARAAEWYLKAAEAGLASAQYNLGIYHELGRGVRKSPAEAVRWFALAAAQGHAMSQNNLATHYVTGDGIETDPVEAWKWYDLAAKQLDGEHRAQVLRNRDAVSATLSPDQLAAAKRRAADFRPVKR